MTPTIMDLLALVNDAEDDGEVVADALAAALVALVDITGDDEHRPAVNSAEKVARRAIARITNILEEEHTH